MKGKMILAHQQQAPLPRSIDKSEDRHVSVPDDLLYVLLDKDYA